MQAVVGGDELGDRRRHEEDAVTRAYPGLHGPRGEGRRRVAQGAEGRLAACGADRDTVGLGERVREDGIGDVAHGAS